MAYNKVIDRVGNILIDLTNDSVEPSDVRFGKTFHDKSGNVKTGVLNVPDNLSYDTPFTGVLFFDALGRIVAQYSLEEARNLTELPPLPVIEEEGLTGIRWNHTLEDLKHVFAPTVVGACYKTDDEKTHVVINGTYNVPFTITMQVYATSTYPTTIDWGDGTVETFTTTPTHTYTTKGIFTIKLFNPYIETYFEGVTGTTYSVPSIHLGATKNGYFLGSSSENARVLKLKISKHFTYFREDAFQRCDNVELITFEGYEEYASKMAYEYLSMGNMVGDFLSVTKPLRLKSISFPRRIGFPSGYTNSQYLISATNCLKTLKVDSSGTYFISSSAFSLPEFRVPQCKYINIAPENPPEIVRENMIEHNAVVTWLIQADLDYVIIPPYVRYLATGGSASYPSYKIKHFDLNEVNTYNFRLEYSHQSDVIKVPNSVTKITNYINARVIYLDTFSIPPTLSNTGYVRGGQSDTILVLSEDNIDVFKNDPTWGALAGQMYTYDEYVAFGLKARYEDNVGE